MQDLTLTRPATSRRRHGWPRLLTLGALLCPLWAHGEANTAPESLRGVLHSIEVSAEQATQSSRQAAQSSGEKARAALEELRQGTRDLLQSARAEGTRAKRTVLDGRDELARWLGLAPR